MQITKKKEKRYRMNLNVFSILFWPILLSFGVSMCYSDNVRVNTEESSATR